jgi:hypothetical protein
MTRFEALQILGLAGGMRLILRNRLERETALRSIADDLVKLAGGVDCQHCEGEHCYDKCEHCIAGWALPKEA